MHRGYRAEIWRVRGVCRALGEIGAGIVTAISERVFEIGKDAVWNEGPGYIRVIVVGAEIGAGRVAIRLNDRHVGRELEHIERIYLPFDSHCWWGQVPC